MRRRAESVALGAALLLALGACSGSPSPAPTPRTSPSASLPAGFPTAVPLPRARVVASSRGNGEWHVRFASVALVADYRTAMRALVGAGFSTTIDEVDAASAHGQACDERLCIGLDATDDPDAGPSLGYEVWQNTGLGPPA